MSELQNPFRVPMFATDHCRAADTRFFTRPRAVDDGVVSRIPPGAEVI